MPDGMIRSAMPCTAPNGTSLAAENAPVTDWYFTQHRSGVFVRDSNQRINMFRQLNETLFQPEPYVLRPSKEKVWSQPQQSEYRDSLANFRNYRCSTGIPVPPPMPAVIKTISAPRVAFSNTITVFHRCQNDPSGLAPAPRPASLPGNCEYRTGRNITQSLCISVGFQTNSTPSILFLSSMCPYGITAATTYTDCFNYGALCCTSSTISNISPSL